MRFLDNVLSDFIENAPDEFSDATYSAIKERSVGLGVMGLHSYFQKKMIPLESVMSKVRKQKIFKQIHDMKKYNLNEKSVLNNIEDLLKNETK